MKKITFTRKRYFYDYRHATDYSLEVGEKEYKCVFLIEDRDIDDFYDYLSQCGFVYSLATSRQERRLYDDHDEDVLEEVTIETARPTSQKDWCTYFEPPKDNWTPTGSYVIREE